MAECGAAQGAGRLPLRVAGLSKRFGARPILQDLSFTLGGDGLSVILGPNGAGKTVLLRLLHGLLLPDAGVIEWDGQRPQRAMDQLGMVFQKPVMLRRTVRANVAFALARSGVPRAARRAQADAALAAAGLAALAGAPAPRLSSGEAQLLAITRAWAQRPRVLLLDEPCANLDPPSTLRVETLVRAIVAAGTRVLLTTHDLAQARRLADEVLFLAGGRLCEQTPAARFFAAAESAEARAFIAGGLLIEEARQG
jgi:tungstate transport system ATP-binding protein